MAAEALAREKREQRILVVKAVEGAGLWRISAPNGGPPPLPLQGYFTSEEYATKAIERYAATGR